MGITYGDHLIDGWGPQFDPVIAHQAFSTTWQKDISPP